MPDINSNPSNALLIFAKWPEPGRVKTRLSPPLSEQAAADLYRLMLLDTLESTREIDGIKRLIFFDGDPGRIDDFRALAPDADVMRQEGADLGARLANAFAKAFSMGCQTVAAIGTDSPHMPIERVTEAFDLLNGNGADVVFGPSEDGGYYLVRMRLFDNALFRDIPWSSSEVLATSIARAESSGFKVTLLPTGFDLDTTDDLLRLKNMANAPAARRTREYLNMAASE